MLSVIQTELQYFHFIKSIEVEFVEGMLLCALDKQVKIEMQAIKYSNCLILKILSLLKQENLNKVGLRNVLNNLYIHSLPQFRKQIPELCSWVLIIIELFKMTIFFKLFEQEHTHTYVKISRPFLIKRLENVVIRTSGGQYNSDPSSSGNPKPTIIWGWVLLVKHIAAFKYYFQNHIDLYLLREIYISINSLEPTALWTDVCRGVQKSGGWGEHFIPWVVTADSKTHVSFTQSL